jgi:hypothetical protein
MTFDQWFDSQSKEMHNYACYEQYSGSVYSLMEIAWKEGWKQAVDTDLNHVVTLALALDKARQELKQLKTGGT